MRGVPWRMVLGLLLVVFSFFLYIISFLIFKDIRDNVFYFLQDFAFLPVQVFFVSLIVNEWTSRRERSEMLKKMNMVIGVFFSETGSELMKILSIYDRSIQQTRGKLQIQATWDRRRFDSASREIQKIDCGIDSRDYDLEALNRFFAGKREFLLGLLENPNLLEHQTFTDLLWAAFHMAEELSFRKNLAVLPESDYDHLSIDFIRVYRQLILEWLMYMKHLKQDYPYLYSLAVRMNPFNPDAGPVVGK